MAGIALSRLVAAMEDIAPLGLAADWDNVGLLLSPSTPRRVQAVLLCVDLTEEVCDEAVAGRVGAVIAYHPPWFEATRRLVPERPRDRVLLRLIERRIAVYSPHTAADAAPGGVNDWLADGLGDGRRRAIERPRVAFAPSQAEGDPPVAGQGRLVVLDRPVSLPALTDRVKRHLGLASVRVAQAASHERGEVREIAVCAGAGAEVLMGASADVLLTGEMRHHDVLAANAGGRSVILCDHTNTERGYLKRLRARLRGRFPDLPVLVSTVDRDPLEVR